MKIKILLLLLILLTGYLLPQQQVDIPWSTLANSPWPMIGHDPQITGRSPYVGPKTPTIIWTLDLQYGVDSGPILDENGTLYVGTGIWGGSENSFRAIYPNGNIKWIYSTGIPSINMGGYLINNEGTIFFGSQSGWLYAVDTSGNLKWKYDTGSPIYQRVMNTDLEGNIYITNSSDSLFSFTKDGILNWKVKYSDGLSPYSVSFSTDGQTIYIAGTDRNIYMLDLNGNIKDTIIYNNLLGDRQPILIDNQNNVYNVSRYGSLGQGAIISFNPQGDIRWTYIINEYQPGLTESSPAMDYEGNIYFIYQVDSGDTDYCRLESIDYNGNYRWTYQFNQEDEIIEMPLVVDKDGTIYCGSSWGFNYYAVSKNGELLWQIPLGGPQNYVDNTTAIGSDGTLYIGIESNYKTIIAIRDTGNVSVDYPVNTVSDFNLYPNYPNPFNPNTIIKWQSPISGYTILKVYDLLGREVALLVNEYKESGIHTVEFDGKDLSSGVYIFRIQVDDYLKVQKMILQK